MTRYTPNYSWPVAEDNDVLKQYPVIVDDPFKAALDSTVKAISDTVDTLSAGLRIEAGLAQLVTDSWGSAGFPLSGGMGTIVAAAVTDATNNAVFASAVLVKLQALAPDVIYVQLFDNAGTAIANRSDITVSYIVVGY